MASRQVALHICRNCRIALGCAAEYLRIPRRSLKYAQRSIFTTAALVLYEAKQKLDLQAPDGNRLKQEHMLKAASANAADTVTTLLSQTAYSLIETERKYRDMVTTLMQLLEYHTAVLGHEEEEKRLMDIISEARGWLQAYHKHIVDLELLLSSVQKLADASAEVAFLSGSEFTSTSLGERMYHANRHIDAAREQRQQIEAQLQEVEAQCTAAIAKHAEKKERRQKAEDELFGTDVSEEEQQEVEQEKPTEKDRFVEEVTGNVQTEQYAKENLETTF